MSKILVFISYITLVFPLIAHSETISTDQIRRLAIDFCPQTTESHQTVSIARVEEFNKRLYAQMNEELGENPNLFHPCTNPEHIRRGLEGRVAELRDETLGDSNQRDTKSDIKAEPILTETIPVPLPIEVVDGPNDQVVNPIEERRSQLVPSNENSNLNPRQLIEEYQILFAVWANKNFEQWATDKAIAQLNINPYTGMNSQESVDYSELKLHYMQNAESILSERIGEIVSILSSTFQRDFNGYWDSQLVEQTNPNLYNGVIPAWNYPSTEINSERISDQGLLQTVEPNSAEFANSRAIGLLYKESGDPEEGRVALKTSHCTSFLISKDLIMTNEHCLTGDKEKVKNTSVRFGYDHHLSGEFFKCGELIYSDPGLDLAVLRCSENNYGKLPGEVYGYLSLSDKPILPSESLYFIGHPLGDKKHISIAKHSRLFNSGMKMNYYVDSRTKEGSSGSPLFSQSSHRVIGLVNSIAGNSTAAIKMEYILNAIKNILNDDELHPQISFYRQEASAEPSIVEGQPYSEVVPYLSQTASAQFLNLDTWRPQFSSQNYEATENISDQVSVQNSVVRIVFDHSVYKRRSTLDLIGQTKGSSNCTGNLISRDLILTNAHCVEGNIEKAKIFFDDLITDHSLGISCPNIVVKNYDLDMAIIQCRSDLSTNADAISLSRNRNLLENYGRPENHFYTVFFIGKLNDSESNRKYYAEGRFVREAPIDGSVLYTYPPFQKSKEGTSGSLLYDSNHSAISLNYGVAENYDADKNSTDRYVGVGTPVFELIDYIEAQHPDLLPALNITD